MKKALILGITGTFGKQVAIALQKKGWGIKALVRTPEKVSVEFAGADILKGDAAHYDDVNKASEDVSLIVYGVSPANYQWEGKVIPWLEVTASVAEEKKLTLIFPGNLYNFDPRIKTTITEKTIQSPIVRKGQLRQKMEQRLKVAADRGAQVIIFRMGDFIVADAKQSWLPRIIKICEKKNILYAPGPADKKHSWAYVPDAANSIALLVENKADFPRFNIFPFKGYQVSINEIAMLLEEKTHKKTVIKSYPWLLLNIVRPFSVAVQGIFEMRYLWRTELNLDDRKLKLALPNKIPSTPLAQALSDAGYLK